MSSIGPIFLAVLGGIIGLAVISVLVSKNAQAPQVISSAGQALGGIIGAAVQPITGQAPTWGSNAQGALGTSG